MLKPFVTFERENVANNQSSFTIQRSQIQSFDVWIVFFLLFKGPADGAASSMCEGAEYEET